MVSNMHIRLSPVQRDIKDVLLYGHVLWGIRYEKPTKTSSSQTSGSGVVHGSAQLVALHCSLVDLPSYKIPWHMSNRETQEW